MVMLLLMFEVQFAYYSLELACGRVSLLGGLSWLMTSSRSYFWYEEEDDGPTFMLVASGYVGRLFACYLTMLDMMICNGEMCVLHHC